MKAHARDKFIEAVSASNWMGTRKWETTMTEFRQPIQVQSHLEMPGILVQLGCIQRT